MSFLWHLFIVDWQYQLWCANGLDCSMEPQIMCVSDQTKLLKVMDCIQRSIDINHCPLLHSLRSQHHMLDASGSCSVSLYHVHEIYFMCICSETDYISQKKLAVVHSRRNTARLGKEGCLIVCELCYLNRSFVSYTIMSGKETAANLSLQILLHWL